MVGDGARLEDPATGDVLRGFMADVMARSWAAAVPVDFLFFFFDGSPTKEAPLEMTGVDFLLDSGWKPEIGVEVKGFEIVFCFFDGPSESGGEDARFEGPATLDAGTEEVEA